MVISEWNKKDWDIFVDSSPQGTVFHKSYFLESYGEPVKYLRYSKGEESLAGFAFIELSEGMKLMPYQAFSGIIMRDFSGLDEYERNEHTFNILETFAGYLFQRYSRVEFSNHWTIIDMRPFDWLNYYEREKGYYRINICYTSHLDISRPTETTGYARLRRRDLKKGTENNRFITRESDDIELLNSLHDMNFKKQKIERPKIGIRALKNICQNLIQAKAGKLFVTYMNDEPAVASFFIYDRFRAYHLFVGTDLRWKDLGVGTKNLHDCCIYLNENLNIKELDMVGINSPKRGAYKLSYGGKIVPYYQVIKVPPQE
jgi:hypothetical protein